MDIKPTLNLKTLVLPLELYTKTAIAKATNKDGTEFEIFAGLDRQLADKLRKHSLDNTDEELKITSDRKRFGEGSYEDWYKKGRVPFALVHSATGQLAALAWFGPKPLGRKPIKHLSELERNQDESTMQTDDWHTLSYRSYKPFRGQGLMKSFVGYVMDEYISYYPNAKFWEGVDAQNPASTALALSLGFKVKPEISDPDGKWLVMVKE